MAGRSPVKERETGLEALAKQAASQGKTAAQQARFYNAVKNVAGTGLLVLGASKVRSSLKGAAKGVKARQNESAQSAASGAGSVKERIRAIEARTSAEAEMKVGDARTATDHLNKAPYHPRTIEAYLQEQHGASNVQAHTIAPKSAPNARLGRSGQPHPQTGVPFDQRGFPNMAHSQMK